ncbi:hypothetical protein K0M31_012435 [Melipona bicolor]|uniref:Uncharacterized protein n=1 Tax=Melipona bicolor TaxID=60889 RepID=A0AA40KHE7_9HYME|nr:hypothetical protein K0M31_012435 [Melipona bicolor]
MPREHKEKGKNPNFVTRNDRDVLTKSEELQEPDASRVDIHSSQLTRLTYSGSQLDTDVKTGLTGFKEYSFEDRCSARLFS